MRRAKECIQCRKKLYFWGWKHPQIYEGIMGVFFVVILEEKGEFLRVAAVKRFAGEKIDHPRCLSTPALKYLPPFPIRFKLWRNQFCLVCHQLILYCRFRPRCNRNSSQHISNFHSECDLTMNFWLLSRSTNVSHTPLTTMFLVRYYTCNLQINFNKWAKYLQEYYLTTL